MRKICVVIMMVIAVTGMSFFIGIAHSTTITVDDDGPADYSRIDTALTHTDEGDTVFVLAGNYYQYISPMHIPWWARPIYLIGAGAESTIVTWESWNHVCNFGGIEGEIRGFTFQGSTDGAGIATGLTRCQIYDCILRNNIIGLKVDHTGSGVDKIHIERNIIINNRIGIRYHCIPELVPPTTDSAYVIRNNLISNNRIGIYFDHEFEGIIPPETIDVIDNWWGTSDTAEVYFSIYDSHLNPAVARTFQYFPFLTDSIAYLDTSEQGGIHRNNICNNMYYNIRCWSSYLEDSLIMAIREPTEGVPIRDINLIAFPNPFNSSCRISVPDDATVEIFDMMGKKVWEYDVETRHAVSLPNETSTFTWRPDKSTPSGIYLVRASMENGQTITERIMFLR